jgi:hypothetical protein
MANPISNSDLKNLVGPPTPTLTVNVSETANRIIKMVEVSATRGLTSCQWTVRFPDMSVAPHDDKIATEIVALISDVYTDSVITIMKERAVFTKNATHITIIKVDWS